MSHEGKAAGGERVSWVLFPTSFNDREVHVGNYEFDRTDFSIGMLQFVYGAKNIQIGSVWIKIPEKTDDVVELGHLILPYDEFVEGFIWHITNGGRLAEEHQVPLSAIQHTAALVLRDKLLQSIPERYEEGLRFALELKQRHEASMGIYGMKTSANQVA